MSRLSLVNGAAVVVALVASVAMASRPRLASEPRADASGAAHEGSGTELADATGARVPLREFSRIASASTVADRLLLDLCDARRVTAVTTVSAHGPSAHRFSGRVTIDSIDDTEALVGLAPDLLLVHNVADTRRVERLREAGLLVFDLGPLEGLRSLRDDIENVATLCGAGARGGRYADTLERRMAAVANRAPRTDVRRRSAIYLSIYADRVFGGTVGTSYHDVLTAAGFSDAAARRHRAWPQYSIEQVLELDPDLVVTRTGMGDALCGHPALGRLRACREDDGVIELDAALLDDPGPGMLDAAEALHAAAHPP